MWGCTSIFLRAFSAGNPFSGKILGISIGKGFGALFFWVEGGMPWKYY